MTVERWRMLSGRVAQLDTAQPTPAVEDAREMLRAAGATRIADVTPVQAFAGDEYDEERAQRAGQRNAPDAVAAARGENQNTREREPVMPIMTDTVPPVFDAELVRGWVDAYRARRSQLIEQLHADPAFMARAAARADLTLDQRTSLAIDDLAEQLPPFPAAALPAWVRRSEVGSEIGGEVTIFTYGQEHTRGDAFAQARSTFSVQVSGATEPLATVHYEGTIMVDSTGLYDGCDTDWHIVADTAQALAALAAEMKSMNIGESR